MPQAPEQREPTTVQRKGQWVPPALHLCLHPAQFLRRTTGPEGRGKQPYNWALIPPPFIGMKLGSIWATADHSEKRPNLVTGCGVAMPGTGLPGQHVTLGGAPGRPAALPLLLLGFQLPQHPVLPRLQPPWGLPACRHVPSPQCPSRGERKTHGDLL